MKSKNKKIDIQKVLDKASEEVAKWPDWMRSPDVEEALRKIKMNNKYYEPCKGEFPKGTEDIVKEFVIELDRWHDDVECRSLSTDDEFYRIVKKLVSSARNSKEKKKIK